MMLAYGENRYLLDHIRRTLSSVVASQKAAAERGTFQPAHVNVRFGGKAGATPAAEVKTPAGHLVQLQGKIDRIDVLTAFPTANPPPAWSIIACGAEAPKATAIYHGLAHAAHCSPSFDSRAGTKTLASRSV